MSVEDWIDDNDDNYDPEDYLTMEPFTVQRQQLWYTKTGDTIKICDMTDRHLMFAFNKSGDVTLFKEMVFRLFKRRVTEEEVGKSQAKPIPAEEFTKWVGDTWNECQEKAWKEEPKP